MHIRTVLAKLVAYDHLAMASPKSVLVWFNIYFLTRNILSSYFFQKWVSPQVNLRSMEMRQSGSFRRLSRGGEKRDGIPGITEQVLVFCNVLKRTQLREHRDCGERRSRSVSPFLTPWGSVSYSTICPAQTQWLSTFYCPYSKHTCVICLIWGLYPSKIKLLELRGLSNLPWYPHHP